MRNTFFFGLACVVAACGSSSSPDPEPSAPTSDANANESAPAAPPPASSTPAPASSPPAPPVSLVGRCGAPVPPGAIEAPAFPVYAGTCPAFAAAPDLSTVHSGSGDRHFMLVKPQAIAAGEKLPIVFVWHWLGGEPVDALERLELQDAVDKRHFVAVVPEAKGDILFRWPFGINQSDGRLEQELQFFDDMLGCVAQTLPVDKNCVSSIGVSAGALFTDQLASHRSERLASFASLSGGVGGQARDWTSATHALPGLVLWGGPDDMYPASIPLEHFDTASKALEDSMAPDGHLIVECTHNCGHALPPFDPPPPGAPRFDFVWSFLLDHPFWLPKGASVYQTSPPPSMPAWCGIGKGAAVPRSAGAACE